MSDKGSGIELRWERLRSHNNSVQEAFEELCSLLQKYRADYGERVRTGWRFVRKGKPDSGIECFWRAPTGQVEGMQAKWYVSSPSASQWTKIDESVEKAIEEHPTLSRLTICLPLDRADQKIIGRKSGKKSKSTLNKWDERVRKWDRVGGCEGDDGRVRLRGNERAF